MKHLPTLVVALSLTALQGVGPAIADVSAGRLAPLLPLCSSGTEDAVSLVSADLDADGIRDLVSGHSRSSGGRIQIHRGNVSFNAALPVGVGDGEAITATATVSWNDTSEFSACVRAVCQQTFSMGQTIEALDAGTFRWEWPANVRFVKGDLAEVTTYSTFGGGSMESANTLDISVDHVAPGSGVYYLVRLLACGSWQTAAGEQPERDAELP